MDYKKYCDDCKKLGHQPTMSEKQFNEMLEIKEEEIEPLNIERKANNEKKHYSD